MTFRDHKNGAVITLILILSSLMMYSGCGRERTSRNAPIHLNPNMDNQQRYDPQSQSAFFSDSATMRFPVVGTVARRHLNDDDVYYRGIKSDGSFIEKLPIDITSQLLNRGRERYDIYCSPCHSRLGDGRGIIVKRGYVPPPSFHDDRIRNMPDGEIYDLISNGVGNMPSYKHQIPVADRWAIVAYLRVLQRSQNASYNDIPEELRTGVK